MDRRHFIRRSCLFCAGITGGVMAASLFESCSPLPYYKTISAEKKITVPLTAFGDSNFLIVNVSDFKYEIAVIKQANDVFNSLVMQCTHASNSLTFNGSKFNCNLHGSAFRRTGEVEKGPAEKPLISLKTDRNSDNIVIHLL